MYGDQGLQDVFFIMFYGWAALLAILACFYFLFSRGNLFSRTNIPPKELRRWTAAFMAAVAASHVWWYVMGIYILVDDRLVRNIVGIMLDHITLVPLVMAMLLRMLQDRRRQIWLWVLTQVPIIVAATVGIVRHDEFYGFEMTTYWQLTVMIVFVIYYIYSLVKYGRWLHENYADLEHKEVWQSLLFMVALFAVYEVYFTNPGEMVKEYLAQVNTIVIIAFLLWRVETLQTLEPIAIEPFAVENEDTPKGIDIGALLQQHCEDNQLYLQHDLTLQQLAIAVGTNRTYLSSYFAQQGITYNAYINRLRIEHFIQLFRESVGSSRTTIAKQLAQQSGFYSYSTFSAAFKKFKGDTVTAWMRSEEYK